MFIAELGLPKFSTFDLTTLRTGMMAGAPCPVEIMKRVVEEMHCPQLTIGYGQTESTPVVVFRVKPAGRLPWLIVQEYAGMPTEAEIREFCRGKIAHFKIPEHIRFVDSFPTTVTGKIQKFKIRQQEIEERGMQAVAQTKTA